MTDIPEDVMKLAAAAVDAKPEHPPFKADVRRVVARAIMAERERCAAAAESFLNGTDYELEPEAAVAENVTARFIAAAIRKGAG